MKPVSSRQDVPIWFVVLLFATIVLPILLSAAPVHAQDPVQYQVSFNVNPSGGGSTDPSGTMLYDAGSLISIFATPTSGYMFSGWSVSNSSSITIADPSSTPTTATIDGYGTITANFNPTTAIPAETQTVITCNPGSVSVGTGTTCTATVTSGSSLTGALVSWSAEGSGIFDSISCTLDGSPTACSVIYTPTDVGSGVHMMVANYVGDAGHLDSSGRFNLTVTGSTSSTTNITTTATSSTVTTSGQAAIWTDKADYSPGETPTIYGTGFDANANITVTVIRPDGTVNTWSTISDDTGSFTTTYALDGIEGLYTVTATDGTNTATTTFTDDADKYTLSVTVTNNGGGSVTSNTGGINCPTGKCSADYNAGTSVTLTATPDTGGAAAWSGNCAGVTGITCTVTMSSAKSVTVTFSFGLAVTKSGTGSGTVTSSPSGISCGSTCSASFPYGTVVTLTAAPATGSAFSNWGGACSGGTCVVTMNVPRSVTATFNLADTTPPVITSNISPSPNANGWNKENVAVSWSVSDPESGIASSTGCGATTLTTETAGTTLTCSATNGVGLSNSVSVTIRLDKTAPTISGAATTSPNANGWYKADVTVHWTCADALSTVDTCSLDETLTSEAAAQSATGTVVDKAGNSASATVSGINIDKTAPTLTVPADITKEATGSTGAVVTYTVTISDNLDVAPVLSCSPGSGSLFPIGTTTVTCTGNDVAGNSASKTFKIIVTVIATKIEYKGAIDGQYSDSVSLTGTLTEKTSGKAVPGKTITFTIGTQSVTGITNSLGVATATLKLDQGWLSGGYTVTASFAGDSTFGPISASTSFTIKKEDVTVEYTGDTIVPTTACTTTTCTFNLRALVQEAQDGSLGNLANAWVTFRIYSGSTISGSPIWISPLRPVSSVGVASVQWEAGKAEASYVVTATLDDGANRYYDGPQSQPVVLSVYSPTNVFVTGGGWIWDTKSSGHGNFGFVVRYNNKGQPQGQSVYVYRYQGYDWVIKSNSWSGGGLFIKCQTNGACYAYFQGKANVEKIDPATGLVVWSAGNYQVRVDIWDNTKTPYNSGIDTYQITVRDSNGVLFWSAGGQPPSAAGNLQGGQIVVHAKPV